MKTITSLLFVFILSLPAFGEEIAIKNYNSSNTLRFIENRGQYISNISIYDEALYKFIDDSSTKTFISSFAGSNDRIFLFDTTVFNSPSGYLNYTYNFYYGFDGHYLSDTNFRHNYRQMLRNWDSISKSWKPQFLTVNNEFPLDSCDFILYSTGIYDDGLLIFEIYPLKPKREWYKVTHLDYRIIIGFTKAQIGLFFIKHGKIEKYRTTQYTID